MKMPARNTGPIRAKMGFTLIELLIVVAIIAILAAIAVPNFLEAQTRSKVSRVLADLRSQRTAIESYAVDWNKYPFGTWGCPPINDTVEGEPAWGTVPETLTTPISYMTKILQDPFMVGHAQYQYERYYTYDTYDTAYKLLSGGISFCPVPNKPNLVFVVGGATYLRAMQEYMGSYYLWSVGPAGPNPDSGGGNVDTYFLIYDSTNGTLSRGRLFVTQKASDLRYVPYQNFF